MSYYLSSPTHSSLQPRPPPPTCFLPPNRGFPRVGLPPISPLGHALRARAPLGLSFLARSPVGGSCVLGIPGLSIVGFLQTSGTYSCHPLPRFYRRDSMGPAHRSHPCEASHILRPFLASPFLKPSLNHTILPLKLTSRSQPSLSQSFSV